MIQPVGRRIHEPFPVRDGDAAPRSDQRNEIGRLAGLCSARALVANAAPVPAEFVEQVELLGVVDRPEPRLAEFRRQRLVLQQRLLDLQRVVRHQLRGRIDRRQAPADDDSRQPRQQIRQGLALEGAGELKRHQEVAGFSDPADQVVLDVDDRRTSGTCRDGHVIEPIPPGVLNRDGAAEPDATIHPEAGAPGERQMQQRQEILVPPDGNAVFGHAAKPIEHPLVERMVDLAPVADGRGRFPPGSEEGLRQRLNFQSVDADDAEPFVHEVMRQRVPGGPEAHHEDVLAVVWQRVGPADVQRVPPGQQPVDLDAERHREHIGQDPGFDLRDVDRLLLLVDARLHAIVADAVAGTWTHRIVQRDERESAEGVALLSERVHLGNLLVERASAQLDAERVDRNPAVPLVKPFGAGVLVALVAQHAVVNLAQDLAGRHPRVGQLEAVTGAESPIGPHHRFGQLWYRPLHVDQPPIIERFRKPENHPVPVGRIVNPRRTPPLEAFDLGREI